MVLRSQSCAGHSEVVVSAEIHPEGPGVAPRPEPEIERPEVEFLPVAGPSSDHTAVGTSSPSPPTRCGTEFAAETLSGYPFPAREEPEITPIPFHLIGNTRSFTIGYIAHSELKRCVFMCILYNCVACLLVIQSHGCQNLNK